MLGLISAAGAYRGNAIVNGAVDGIAERLIDDAANVLLNALPNEMHVDHPAALSRSFQLPANQSANCSLAYSGMALSGLKALHFKTGSLTRTATSARANITISAQQLSLSSGLRGSICIAQHCVTDVQDGSIAFDLRAGARMEVGIKSIIGVPVMIESICIGPVKQAKVENVTVTGLGGLYDAVAAEAASEVFGALEAPIVNELESVIEKLQPKCSFSARSSVVH